MDCHLYHVWHLVRIWWRNLTDNSRKFVSISSVPHVGPIIATKSHTKYCTILLRFHNLSSRLFQLIVSPNRAIYGASHLRGTRYCHPCHPRCVPKTNVARIKSPDTELVRTHIQTRITMLNLRWSVARIMIMDIVIGFCIFVYLEVCALAFV